ncbi:hypothetical protein RQP46_003871 [Phenoliferia psychrophenolica]
MSSVASRLNEPISSVDELVTLLSPILASLSLLPSSLTPPPLDPPTPASLLKRQLSQIQSTLITSLWLTWEHALDPQLPAQLLFRPLLVPPPDAPFATEIALSAYNTIISLLSSSSSSTTKHSPTGPLHHAPTLILVATLLKDLHLQYKLDNLARVVFKTGTTQLELQRWTAVLRDLVQVPTKVANAAGAFLPYRCDIPQELIWSNYFSTLSQSFPTLLLSLSAPAPALSLTLSQLLLHAPHLFSPSLSPSPTPSFFSTLLPPLLPLPFPSPPELLIARASAALLLRDALSDLPHRDLVKILLALFSTLDQYLAKHPSKNAGKGAAWILSEVLGDVANENEVAEVAWEVVLDPKKEWSVELARALALWTGKVGTTEVEDRERVVARVAKVWCDPSGINDSSVPSRLSISTHLSLLRPIPRLLGMLTAEVVSAHTVAPGEENAVELAFVLIGLTDQFETDDFDRLRLAALAALVAAVPTKVAPALIEQYFFPHYSVSQRYTLLTALALGARELAGIPALPPLPPSSTSTPTPSLPIEPLFPSKQLPPSLHRRLVGPSPSTPPPPPAPTSSAQLDQLSSSLSQSALSSTRTSIESSLPDASRSKLLTVRRFASAPSPSSSSPQNGKPTFSLLSAEFFLGPLINRFWDHLKDASTNPNARPYAQGGASTPTLLDPIILSRYLTTLSVLLHASRHSPHFLSFLAPQALELVLALRSPSTTEPTVLSGQMEVLLVVFDAISSFVSSREPVDSVTFDNVPANKSFTKPSIASTNSVAPSSRSVIVRT